MKYVLIAILSLFTSVTLAKASIWNSAAEKVCGQIQTAVDYYQKDDIKNAKLSALMAYFKGYDAEIEPAVRITLGGPHVFAVERKFRSFSTMITADKTQAKKVAEAAAALCQDVKDDAAALDKANVPRQVFKVE